MARDTNGCAGRVVGAIEPMNLGVRSRFAGMDRLAPGRGRGVEDAPQVLAGGLGALARDTADDPGRGRHNV
ncbi:MAG: hypothetical protein GY938_10565 [Ketobacter sp.]|nr:hypothetical protein [Ketobacter sp.]